MGVPIIVSRRCGAAELVREGENGWLCEPTDAEGLAAPMRLAAERARLGEMTAAARASAQPFGIDAMVQQMARLYAALMTRSAA